jgi:uncharacterized protein (DUF58 family)
VEPPDTRTLLAMSAARPSRIDELLDSALMAKLDRLDLVSRRIFSGKLQGERHSKRRGRSVEFEDFRPYASGDDLRFVDWNIYGRLDRLVMKIFLEEEDLSLLIVLDASASMGFGEPSKFLAAQRVAMALGYLGLVNRNRVSAIAVGGGGVRRLAGLRGRRRLAELGQWLLSQEPQGRVDFTEAMRSIALARQGRGVMVVLSDFLVPGGAERGLAYATGRGYDLFALQILSPEELDPAAEGLSGDLQLVDSEDGAIREVTLSPGVLRAYRQRLDAHAAELRQACARRGIGLAAVSSRTPVEEILLDRMRRRGLLQ